MHEKLICTGCGSTDLAHTGSDNAFIYYKCNHCGRIKSLPCPDKVPAPVDLTPLIRDLTTTYRRLSIQEKHEGRIHGLEEERRHLENRLDFLKRDTRVSERPESAPSRTGELKELYTEQNVIREKIHNTLMDNIQVTPDLTLQLKLTGLAIDNTSDGLLIEKKLNTLVQSSRAGAASARPAYAFASQVSMAKISPAAPDLKARLEKLKQMRLQIEVILIRKNYAVLDQVVADAGSLLQWQNMINDLIQGLQHLRQSYPPSEALSVVEKQFLARLAEVHQRRDQLDRQILARLMQTNLSAALPDNLGHLGREMVKIDQDIACLNSTHDPLAQAFIAGLQKRRRRVLGQIKWIRFWQDFNRDLQLLKIKIKRLIADLRQSN
jgi:hypothetical protein